MPARKSYKLTKLEKGNPTMYIIQYCMVMQSLKLMIQLTMVHRPIKTSCIVVYALANKDLYTKILMSCCAMWLESMVQCLACFMRKRRMLQLLWDEMCKYYYLTSVSFCFGNLELKNERFVQVLYVIKMMHMEHYILQYTKQGMDHIACAEFTRVRFGAKFLIHLSRHKVTPISSRIEEIWYTCMNVIGKR